MRYFKLGQDHQVPYGALLTGVNQIRGYQKVKQGDLSALDRAIVCSVNTSPVTFFPDILDREIYMVRELVQEVFRLFLPHLLYKHCCLLDQRTHDYHIYYIPMIDVLELREGVAREVHLFRIADAKDTTVVASLDLIEAILRRKPTGVQIEPLHLSQLKREG